MTALRPVLFLPGLLCDAALWRGPIDALSDLVAPNVADLTLDDTISAMAERALAAAPPRFSLAGLSMGGYVALEIMRRAPERVERLALLDTSAAPDPKDRIAGRRAGIESMKLGKFHGVTDRLLPQLIHPDHIGTPVAEAVKAMAERVGGDAFIRQQEAIVGRVDSRKGLSAIHVPTVIGVGEHDLVTPPNEAREMASLIPDARLHVFARCGHLPALERPDETAMLLREWLLD